MIKIIIGALILAIIAGIVFWPLIVEVIGIKVCLASIAMTGFVLIGMWLIITGVDELNAKRARNKQQND